MKSTYVAYVPSVVTLICAFIMIGCAADVFRTPTRYTPAAGERDTFILAEDVIVTPISSFRRSLTKGSIWRYVGRVPQGAVYQIKDDVFSLVGRHAHEAYCVISGNSELVGFYLPGEQAFAPLQSSVRLPVQQK
jgi:hypothetical protein